MTEKADLFACFHPRPNAQLRLIGFPHGGGGPQSFYGWSAAMPAHIEVVALSLPGRGPRAEEMPLDDLPTTIAAIVEALSAYFDAPFAFFGHSMGSVLAFEVARQLREQGAPLPVHLFVSAHTGPHLAPRGVGMHRLPDSLFAQELERLGGLPEGVLSEPSLLELILPAARADFRLTEGYRWEEGNPLDIPISVAGGETDATVQRAELEAWKACTYGPFEVRVFKGDHFYLAKSVEPVVTWVASTLDETVAALPRSLLRGPRCAYPEAGLHTLFRAQAERTPDRTAIVDDAHEITYRALAERVDRLAAMLRHRGVGLGDRVGLYLEPCVDYVVAVLAAMEAGGAYMPVEIAYPAALVEQVLDTAAPRVVLSRGAWTARLPAAWRAKALGLDPGWETTLAEAELAAFAEGPQAGPDDLAYCVMSSGTTGVPKGIICPHRGAVNSYYWRYRHHPYRPDDREGSNLFFVWEVIRPLLVGAPTYIIPGDVIYDPPRLVDFIERHRITRMMFTPSLLEQVLDTPGVEVERRLTHLRTIYLSGEVTPAALARRIADRLPQATVLNDYSISECHDVCHIDLKALDPSHSPRFAPVGRPMDNVRLYVLDKALAPVPVGVRGELYVGGDSLGCGYLDQPEMTADRFLPDPFTDEQELMFRTGDAGRVLANGQVEVLGRVAFMIKLRGYSIVPGAVETTLTRFSGIKAAVVTTRDDPQTGQPTDLVAYVVQDGRVQDPLSLVAVRAWLEQTLPHYAVPSYLIQIDALPLAATGKLDRQKLPPPGPEHFAGAKTRDDAPARTETEALVVSIWAEVLSVVPVHPTDNFFHLGGHSLLAARAASSLSMRLGRPVSVVDLFQHPTARALAAHLDGAAPARRTPVRPRRPANDDIAIVGMACRFPGAADLNAFWDALCTGAMAARPLSEDELVAAGVPPDVYRRADYVPVGALLDDVDRFDPEFWGLSVREATLIDPQQRLFLECCWHALENAGLRASSIGERTGVYGGAFLPLYLLHNLRGGGLMDLGDPLTASLTEFGNDKDYITHRTSYLLNLCGPSVTIQSSCSTSLVAVQTAAQALVAGSCDVALAGGASISFPQGGYVYTEGLDSSDGRCRAFDAKADGTLIGDGVGVVVLKRLADAQADGDPIWAIIKGGAINNDGGQKANFAAPSVSGQSAVISAAHAAAGVTADTIDYVEAHGTGTPVGDVIEVRALTAAFAGVRPGRCALGSIKPSIGHSSIASGVAGLIKTALSLHHRQLLPLAGFETVNPELQLDRTPFYINAALRPWPATERPRRAGITSLGIGGTNCHLVLEEPPPPSLVTPETSAPRVLCLSARSPAALARACRALADHIRHDPAIRICDVAHTLHVGREAMPVRAAVVCRDHASAIEALEKTALRVERRPPTPAQAEVESVAFLFPGGGVQAPQMGLTLYQQVPGFRRHFDACNEVVTARSSYDLADILYSGPGAAQGVGLDGITVFQLATFAVEYAMARLLIDAEVQPTALVGHSLGEYVAATIAGVFTIEEAIELLLVRSEVMEAETAPGAMLAARLSEADAIAHLDRLFPNRGVDDDDDAVIGLSLVNGPQSVVFGGAPGPVDAVRRALADSNVRHRALETSNRASHTALMRGSAQALDAHAERITPRSPSTPMTLNASDEWLTPSDTLPLGYWGRQLTGTIRFEDDVRQLLERRPEVLLEVGPNQTLSRLVETIAADARCHPTMRHPAEDDLDDLEHLLETLADAWCSGLRVGWGAFEPVDDARRIPLPGYVFEQVRCWPDPPKPPPPLSAPTPAAAGGHPLLGRRVRASTLARGERLFEQVIAPDAPAWVRDHGDPPLLPATGFVEIAIAAGATLFGDALSLYDMSFERALTFVDGPRVVQTQVSPDGAGRYAVRISSRPAYDEGTDDDEWMTHATGQIGAVEPAEVKLELTDGDAIDVDEFYAGCARRGYHFGPAFRLLTELMSSNERAAGRLDAPRHADAAEYQLHPCLLDACIQIGWALFDDSPEADPYIPVAIERLTLHRPARSAAYRGRVRLRTTGPILRSVDVDLLDVDGRPVATIIGSEEKQVARWALSGRPRWQDWLRMVRWLPRPQPTVADRPGGHILLLADRCGIAERVAHELTEAGYRCTLAFEPDRSVERGSDRFDEADGLERLWATLPALDSIVHLWGLDGTARLEAVDPMAAAQRTCGSTAALIRILADAVETDELPRLLLVTRGAQAIDGRCERPDQAPLWAVAQCVRIEHPEIPCTTVDLDPQAPIESVARALVAEIRGRRAEDDDAPPEGQVAFRSGKRRVARLVPSGIPPRSGLTFRRDASYLITGGLGGIGFYVAQWMGARGAGRIVLLSRSIDKPHLQAPIEALRATGVDVVCVAADVTDGPALARVIHDTPLDRPLRGVMHAAGSLDDGVLLHMNQERFDGVMGTRVNGCWHLHSLTQHIPLDHFVLFSSDAGGLGHPGQANHCAGNAFLDRFAAWRQAEGLPCMSVAWGGWAEIGGGAEAHMLAQLKREGMGVITPDEGMAILETAMLEGRAHVDVTPIYWDRFLDTRSREELAFYAFFRDRVHQSEEQAARSPNEASPASDLEARMHGVLCELLGRDPSDPIDPDTRLFDLGVDSLMALVLKNKLQGVVGARLPATLVYRHPTLRALLAHLTGLIDP